MDETMFQISTLQALSLGYSRSVVTVQELLRHGDTGLGTFEDVNGEMILLDGICYRATNDGSVTVAEADKGVPFASVTYLDGARKFALSAVESVQSLKDQLNLRVEEGFGLNSMHIARIDGDFAIVEARSETGRHSHHISLKEVLDGNQKDFSFENVSGSLVCVYYPDYMDGINAAGWHFHFVSTDKSKGGHVFGVRLRSGTVRLKRLAKLEIQLPTSPAFDTYSLTKASAQEIKQVEQGAQ